MTATLARNLLAFVALGAVALAAAPAEAGTGKRKPAARKKPAADKADKADKTDKATVDTFALPARRPMRADTGAAFDLSRPSRQSSIPTGDAMPIVELRGLSAGQIGDVVRARLDDVEYCWLRIPSGQRAAGTAMIKLTIDASGAVTTAAVDGVPAEASACISRAATGWAFPAADIATDAEYAIELH